MIWGILLYFSLEIAGFFSSIYFPLFLISIILNWFLQNVSRVWKFGFRLEEILGNDMTKLLIVMYLKTQKLEICMQIIFFFSKMD